jgi:hypothetical protein
MSQIVSRNPTSYIEGVMAQTSGRLTRLYWNRPCSAVDIVSLLAEDIDSLCRFKAAHPIVRSFSRVSFGGARSDYFCARFLFCTPATRPARCSVSFTNASTKPQSNIRFLSPRFSRSTGAYILPAAAIFSAGSGVVSQPPPRASMS